MDLFERLNKYKAWTLSRYEQPWEDGAVADVYYVCSIFHKGDWTQEQYAITPELALERAEEELDGDVRIP